MNYIIVNLIIGDRSSMRASLREKRYFTLIELLIVIAIIAILASMLLPTLNQARERGKNATCTSNMKNLFMAQSLYAGDFEYFCPGATSETAIGFNEQYMSVLLRPYLGIPVTGFTDWNDLHALMKRRELLCPSQAHDRGSLTISYVPNAFTLLISMKKMSKAKVIFSLCGMAAPESRVPGISPSRIYFLMENGYLASSSPEKKETNRYVVERAEFDGDLTSGVTSSFRHLGSKNVVMMDGSLRPVKRGMTEWQLYLKPGV